MLLIFSTNLVKLKKVWPARIPQGHLFRDGGSRAKWCSLVCPLDMLGPQRLKNGAYGKQFDDQPLYCFVDVKVYILIEDLMTQKRTWDWHIHLRNRCIQFFQGWFNNVHQKARARLLAVIISWFLRTTAAFPTLLLFISIFDQSSNCIFMFYMNG